MATEDWPNDDSTTPAQRLEWLEAALEKMRRLEEEDAARRGRS